MKCLVWKGKDRDSQLLRKIPDLSQKVPDLKGRSKSESAHQNFRKLQYRYLPNPLVPSIFNCNQKEEMWCIEETYNSYCTKHTVLSVVTLIWLTERPPWPGPEPCCPAPCPSPRSLSATPNSVRSSEKRTNLHYATTNTIRRKWGTKRNLVFTRSR